MKYRKMRFIVFLTLLLVALSLFAFIKFFNGNIIYFTTGLDDTTVFKVEDKTATQMEAEILFSDSKSEYEDFFGEGVWKQQIDGISFEDYAKNQIKSKMIRIKCMNLLSKERGVVLDRTELGNVDKAVKEYMTALTVEQISSMGITENKLTKMFTEYAIANRLFDDMTSKVNAEVSSDQARVIKIQYISTDSEDLINRAKARLEAAESFFFVAREINHEGEYEYELKRGEMDTVFEDTAFNLKSGEVSSIIKAGNKFFIIKCISDNDKTKTETNKSLIIENQKLEAFNKVFESYEASFYIDFNHKLWNDIKIPEAIKTSISFQSIFDKYFN